MHRSSTFTPQSKSSLMASKCACSNTGNMRSSRPPTGANTPFPKCWSSYRPGFGSSWGNGTLLVTIRQLKHSLLHHNIPVAIWCSNNSLITPSGAVALATIAWQWHEVKPYMLSYVHTVTLAVFKYPVAKAHISKEGAFNLPINPPFALPGLVQNWRGLGNYNIPYHTITCL